MDSLVDLAPGTHVNGYRIERRIGAGGFGITYLASDLDDARIDRRAYALNARIGRYLGTEVIPDAWRRWAAQAAGPTVAIKEYFYTGVAVRRRDGGISPSRSDSRSEYAVGLESFLDEAHIAQDLFHPNVVTVFDVFEANSTAYYVMEYVPGETLESRIQRRGRQTPDVVAGWLEELLDGLDYLHARGVLHLDLSPQNVILRAGGESPVLIDFGASRAVAQQKTRNFGRMVNDGYSPPEKYLLGASKLHAPADIYSAAAVAAFALDGAAPPSAMDRTEDPRLAPPLADTPDPMRRAVLQGLSLDVRRRPQSVAAWRSQGLIPKRKGKPASGDAEAQTSGEERLRLLLRTTIIPVASVAGITLIVVYGAFFVIHVLQGSTTTPEARLIQEAQEAYCAHVGQGGTAADQARATVFEKLNQVAQSKTPYAPEAEFRLGVLMRDGGFLASNAAEGPKPVCGDADHCLDAAAADHYQPALVFVDSHTGGSTRAIGRPALQDKTVDPAGWPPGLHPLDCTAKVDLNPEDWTGS